MVSMPSRRDSSCPVQMVKVRQSIRIDDSSHAPVVGEVVDEPLGDLRPSSRRCGPGPPRRWSARPPRRRARRPVHGLVEPRLRAVAVLVVDRVDAHRPPSCSRPASSTGGLGGVEHDRQRGRGGEPAGQLAHVGDAVAADVVDAEVEQVRAVAGLVPGDLDAASASPRRASPRGTPWSRWRWSARRSSAPTRPARTAPTGTATPPPARGDVALARAARPEIASATSRMCSGVVPQQPPTSDRP